LDRTLEGEDVANISDVADRNSTWLAPVAPLEDTPQLNRDFGELREQVRRATRVRIGWGILAFAVLCTVIWVSTVLFVEHLMSH
ncbi:MAG TPA: hypothetical protein VGI56_01990, partial [Galbitalea sp.]